MQTFSIGELQKNVGMLLQLVEPIAIIDKRKNKGVKNDIKRDRENIRI